MEKEKTDHLNGAFFLSFINGPTLHLIDPNFGNVDDAVHFLQRAPTLLLTDDGVAKLFVQVVNELSAAHRQRLSFRNAGAGWVVR